MKQIIFQIVMIICIFGMGFSAGVILSPHVLAKQLKWIHYSIIKNGVEFGGKVSTGINNIASFDSMGIRVGFCGTEKGYVINVIADENIRDALVSHMRMSQPDAMIGKYYRATLIFCNDPNDSHPMNYMAPSLIKGMGLKINEVVPGILGKDEKAEWIDITPNKNTAGPDGWIKTSTIEVTQGE